jgi:hypothetical protein
VKSTPRAGGQVSRKQGEKMKKCAAATSEFGSEQERAPAERPEGFGQEGGGGDIVVKKVTFLL